ncbi:hypothetical protein LIER_01757 [Lithospermum erythrorhizon]|uniref:O-methyltransferase domain-containing protein n=1 Tax=Lithospermum erythrorhizon TaxID=34254 RepID=A0AAV3NMT9_LITER
MSPRHSSVLKDMGGVRPLAMRVLMMINLFNGKERTEKDLAKLFHDAGYTDYKISPVLGLRSLIELYP